VSSPPKPLTSQTQQRGVTGFSWTNPSRERRAAEDEGEIKKPRRSAYDSLEPSEPFPADPTYDSIADGISMDILSPEDLEKRPQVSEADVSAIPPTPPIRMVPRTGRTVHVNKNTDVARSFKMLAVQVAQNRIRQEFQYQRYHERPGMKRKRLASERWRKRFKRGFKETVRRVRELTAQGW